MVDFALAAEREEGKDPVTAIYQACLLRFRPIMLVFDRAGLVLEANLRAQDVLGLEARPAGSYLFDLVHPDDLDPAPYTGLPPISDTAPGVRLEWRLRGRFGHWLQVEVVVGRLDDDGEPRFLAMVSRPARPGRNIR